MHDTALRFFLAMATSIAASWALPAHAQPSSQNAAIQNSTQDAVRPASAPLSASSESPVPISGASGGRGGDPAEMERESYGGALGASYLLSPFLTLGAALLLDSPAALGFLYVPVTVHAAYGNGTGAGVAVLGISGSTVAGGFVGAGIELATTEPCPPDAWLCFRGVTGAFVGALVGYTTWAVVDSAALAHRDVPADRTSASPRVTAGFVPMPGGGVGSVAAMF